MLRRPRVKRLHFWQGSDLEPSALMIPIRDIQMRANAVKGMALLDDCLAITPTNPHG
jgi:hypothetical protein